MIGIPELAVLAFAGYRATQLAVHDVILDPVRDRLFAQHADNPSSRAWTAIIALISCVYCMGWWVSGAVLATYLLASGRWDDAPVLVHAVEWFAVAGAAVLANRWDDTKKAA